MDFTQLFKTYSALENPGFWQEFYMKFYRAWFEADRWKQYLEGLVTNPGGDGDGPDSSASFWAWWWP